jgi:alpha-tubulin suppressor-like RCC1 family protein
MLRSRSVVFLPAIFLLAVLATDAQPVVVDVRLTQPPPNQLRVADLWKIELNNRSNQTIKIYLHGTGEEISIPDGLIVDARSRVIDLPPGFTRVTGSLVQPVNVDEYQQKYYDAMITTGNVPSGEYQICVEAVDDLTGAVLGRDCKFVIVNRMSVPILISPMDESEVIERYPVYTWMMSVPPSPGLDLRYRIRVVEMFGTQTPQDAMTRNPAWFELTDLRRVILQYPISVRGMEVGRKYAWMIEAFEVRAGVPIPLGQSEVWQYTYQPMQANDDDLASRRSSASAPVVKDSSCPGENWDFEIGTLACWVVEGEAFVDDPVLEDHVVLGTVGQNGKYWVTSHGPLNGGEAQGYMLSQPFEVQTSVVAFLYGGATSREAAVELLVERQESDTFSLPLRTLPGSSQKWFIAHSTSEHDEATSSDRLVPVEWNVLRYLNRTAHILIRDSSKTGHINADHFEFYDKEKLDSIKLPVLVMAAGEDHSLAATPEETPPLTLNDKLKADIGAVKAGGVKVAGTNVVNETTPVFKGKVHSASLASIGGGSGSEQPSFDLSDVKQDTGVVKLHGMSNLVGLALKQKNVLWGWGDNSDRSVGVSSATVIKEPRQLDKNKIKDVQALAAGSWHSLAVTNDGQLFAWGQNKHAQLGTDDRSQKGAPTAVNGNKIYARVAAGAFHSLATTKTGDVHVWGFNFHHALGSPFDAHVNWTTGQVDSLAFFDKPIAHPQLKKARSVAAGEAHSVVLFMNGIVAAFGKNDHGQTGQSMDEPVTEEPKVVVFPSQGSSLAAQGIGVAVAAGFDHSLLLDKNGKVWAWGGNASGQLGDGTTTDRSKPEQVGGLNNIRAIAAGDGFSLALDSAGNVWSWGNNVLGQLGDGSRIGKYTPSKVTRIDAVQGIVAGGSHAMAVRADGSLWTWGMNNVGQLGEGPVVNLAPVPLDPPIGPLRVERLALGEK